MKADILRTRFLDFFMSKKHTVVESDSLVPKDDPTVLFTPAGMNQFKKQFLGNITDYTRAASSQRCLRTDDLEKVGKTRGHHTFFEMLGNFSFGDYFKSEAIAWAWEFLTSELQIKEGQLWVSVYKDDEEAYSIWKEKVNIPVQRIVRMGDKENFWPSEAKAKGPNGPCGPCSEIYFDQGKDAGCGKPGCDPSCDCGRFLEVWNLVFTQFNRKEGGALEPLPQKNIDTGMGLERLAAVMQGVSSNFETDLFTPITREIRGHVKTSHQNENELVYAIADHLRAVVFCIYDGVLPSNEGRGYIVRKLIRKSVLHCRVLGIQEPLMYTLVPVLSQVMRIPYPELDGRRENIAEVILAEEKNFIATLNASPSILKEKFASFIGRPAPKEAGAIAFQLYDTYGIPLELIKDWLDKNNVGISMEAFEEAMAEQKSRSKAFSSMKGDVFSVKDLDVKGIAKTVFLGYEVRKTQSRVLKVILNNQIPGDKLANIILDKTVFYPESGGQVYDTGMIKQGNNVFKVLSVKKVDGVIIHEGVIEKGSLSAGDAVEAEIDEEIRLSIARNHTATHLLQAALRKVLGSHVQQQGSLVASDRMRFDFTHFKDIKQDELNRIEETVNEYILKNYPVTKKEMALAEAKQAGALAFFGEKYEQSVRMVAVGDISKELCGGTHLDATGQIGLFKIIQEGSVASGVRRIEAVTGTCAYKEVRAQEAIIQDLSALLNTSQEKLGIELEKRLQYIKELEKKVNAQKFDDAKASVEKLLQGQENICGVKVVTEIVENVDLDLLRKTVDLIKQKIGASYVISLGSTLDKRALLVMATDKPDLDASRMIKAISGEIGGSGGGRKDFAQAGGDSPGGFDKAFEKLKDIISQESGRK